MIQELTIKLHEELEAAAQSQVRVLHRIRQKQRQVLENESLRFIGICRVPLK